MDANRMPCSIEVQLCGGSISVPCTTRTGGTWCDSVKRRDFSPWLTPEALQAFDPDAREAGEFILEVAKAAAVNNERERRRYGRRLE